MNRLLVMGMLLAVGCDYNLTITGPTVSNTNTNTSTNTNSNPIDIHIDSHDVFNFNPAPGTVGNDGTSGNTSPNAPLSIPSISRSIVEGIAQNNQLLIANSCQDTLGPAAWAFMDLVVTTLRVNDTRWGYLGKGGVCTNPSRDVIAYRATSTDVGIWGVDIIGNHCPGPGMVTTFTWNVIGYDAAGKWCFPRQ
jgi:hypothetical protein